MTDGWNSPYRLVQSGTKRNVLNPTICEFQHANTLSYQLLVTLYLRLTELLFDWDLNLINRLILWKRRGRQLLYTRVTQGRGIPASGHNSDVSVDTVWFLEW